MMEAWDGMLLPLLLLLSCTASEVEEEGAGRGTRVMRGGERPVGSARGVRRARSRVAGACEVSKVDDGADSAASAACSAARMAS